MKISISPLPVQRNTTVESAIRVTWRRGRDGVVVTGENHFPLPSRECLRRATGSKPAHEE